MERRPFLSQVFSEEKIILSGTTEKDELLSDCDLFKEVKYERAYDEWEGQSREVVLPETDKGEDVSSLLAPSHLPVSDAKVAIYGASHPFTLPFAFRELSKVLGQNKGNYCLDQHHVVAFCRQHRDKIFNEEQMSGHADIYFLLSANQEIAKSIFLVCRVFPWRNLSREETLSILLYKIDIKRDSDTVDTIDENLWYPREPEFRGINRFVVKVS